MHAGSYSVTVLYACRTLYEQRDLQGQKVAGCAERVAVLKCFIRNDGFLL